MAKTKTPSEKIDDYISEIDDWRRETFAEMRSVILGAAPGITEEWKWMGTPTWSQDGIVAVANAHKGKVKLTFDQGAHLPDPKKQFNAGLEGNQRRAIDFFEKDKINKSALKALIVAAVAYNAAKKSERATKAVRSKSTKR